MNLPAGTSDEPAATPPMPAVDRRRLDEIFGDVLPESTADDRDDAREASGRPDGWYTENRPPHHGG